MILEANTQLVLGFEAVLTIGVTIIGACLAFIVIHFREVSKHNREVHELKNDLQKQDGKINSLNDKVASQQSIIDKFTDRIFDLAAIQEKEKKNK